MPRDLINHLKSKPVTQIANSPKPSDDDDGENPYQVDEELEEVVTKHKDEQSEE